MNKKTLVIFAGIATFIALVAMIFAPAPQMAYAQNPTPAPQPPVAVLKVVAVPANAALPGAITGTLTYITDTAVGAAKTTAAMGTTGLSNVPINVPVRLEVSAADPNNTGKPTWALTKPSDSKAAIKDPAAMMTEFTPDVVGAYMVSVSLKNDAGATSNTEYATFHAGTFIGESVGNCKNCHPEKAAEWAKTGHAMILTEEIDNLPTPDVATHYSESCIRCHTTGWYLTPVGAGSGGFNDAKTAANWTFPTFAQIDAAGKKTGPSNWDAMPASVQNMANIQCEQCHGPAAQHVKDYSNVMAVSFDNGVCDVCHAGGGHHIKGLEINYSKHTTGSSFEEINGPSRQACVRCHSGKGYVSFLKDPTNQAAWDNEEQSVGCATCHDPHSDANFAQLRVVGKPVVIPFEAKDVGLSATCFTCHNARTKPEDAVKSSFPHYSSVAEFLSDTGGVTYGQTVPNSPHAMVVGTAAMPDPSDTTGQTKLFGGNVPGPCVACHMYPGLSDSKDPNYMKVGEHSFNTVSPDGTFDYGAACKSCHGDVKDFNLPAKADYDGNGKTEGVQNEVKGLLDVLWTDLQAKGLKKVDTGYPYATVPSDADDHVKNAWYNFRTVYGVMWGTGSVGNEGKAQAVHNFKRSCALLQLSIKDLTGSLPAGATDCTK